MAYIRVPESSLAGALVPGGCVQALSLVSLIWPPLGGNGATQVVPFLRIFLLITYKALNRCF